MGHLQAWWKGRRQSNAFQQLRSAVVLIQARQRMLAARQRFLRTQGAAVLIQRHMRGCLVRRHMAEQRLAATCIQAGTYHLPSNMSFGLLLLGYFAAQSVRLCTMSIQGYTALLLISRKQVAIHTSMTDAQMLNNLAL